MYTGLLSCFLLTSVFVYHAECLCGDSIKWSHTVNMVDVFGVWYGVGRAQHSPDKTDLPNTVGCISLYITDDNEYGNWFDWSFQRMKYSSRNWRSFESNPWSENETESWLDDRFKSKVKRSVDGERRLRVSWDDDGRILEQVYLYYEEEPGLWTADQLQPRERELNSRGIEVWYPDEPPGYPDVIRILKLTPNTLILNHCSELRNSDIFTLIFRRSPNTVLRWEWYQYQRQFYKFDLPNVYRFRPICAACSRLSSTVIVLFCFITLFLLR